MFASLPAFSSCSLLGGDTVGAPAHQQRAGQQQHLQPSHRGALQRRGGQDGSGDPDRAHDRLPGA